MPWPDKVLRQFQTTPPDSNLENAFHGAYNKLLYTADADFIVVPQYLKPDSSKSSDYIVTFEIFLVNRPVFILELKMSIDLTKKSSRQAADEQIRERLGDLVDRCPIPTLHAVSAIGTRLCFYTLNQGPNAEIVPLNIP